MKGLKGHSKGCFWNGVECLLFDRCLSPIGRKIDVSSALYFHFGGGLISLNLFADYADSDCGHRSGGYLQTGAGRVLLDRFPRGAGAAGDFRHDARHLQLSGSQAVHEENSQQERGLQEDLRQSDKRD